MSSVALGLVPVPIAEAAQITVSTRADAVSPTDGTCSLREAVASANTSAASGGAAGECPAGEASADMIVLPGGTPYFLTPVAGGALKINSAMTISGAGAASTRIDGGGLDRVLDVGSAPAVALAGVTIGGGQAPGGTAAVKTGGAGGGIRNVGFLTLIDAQVVGNRAGPGLAGNNDPGIGKTGGAGGSGGGLYNSGMLSLVRTTVSGNAAGNGGGGFPVTTNAAGAGGRGGPGGGVFNATSGTLNVIDSSITNNRAGAGGAGGEGGFPGVRFVGAVGGDGGDGGGLWNAGTLSVTGSAATGDAGGRGGNGGGAGGDLGPGLRGGPGGNGGFGGGIFDASSASQTVANSTIAANGAGAGGDGVAGGYGGDGGGGGGVVSAGAPLGLVNATLSANQVGAGGADGGGGAGGIGRGGAINAFGAVTAQNTIVAGNSGGNCIGAVTDGGNNLSFPDTTCPGLNGDPRLGSPQDNGGPTPTAALGEGSAAIDQIPASGAGCPGSDQRGLSRPQGPACDIGAFELGRAPLDTAPPASVSIDTPAVSVAPAGPGPKAPTASALRVSPRMFRAAPRGPSATASGSKKKRAKPGARVSYTLSLDAPVRFTVQRVLPGRRQGKGQSARCAAPTRRNRSAPQCSRIVTLGGAFNQSGKRGLNRFSFTGRLNGQALKPGSYKLLASPSTGGKIGRSVTATFEIIR